MAGKAAAKDDYDDVAFSLSDEERAAMADDDDQAAGKGGDNIGAGDGTGGDGGPPSSAATGDGAGAGSGDDKGKTDDQGGKPAGDAKGKTTDDQAAAAGEGEGEEEEEIPRGHVSTPTLRSTREIDSKAAQERITAIDTELESLDAKYENDEISVKEYMRQSRALQNERAEKVADTRSAELLQGSNEALAEASWKETVASFLEENEEFKPENEVMHDALNSQLRRLYADEKNAGASYTWYLRTAAKRVHQQLEAFRGGQGADGAGSDPDLGRPPDPKTQARKTAQAAAEARNKLPRTLGDAPNASASDTGQDKFAELDKLSGVELERKLATMSEEQADEYLRAKG